MRRARVLATPGDFQTLKDGLSVSDIVNKRDCQILVTQTVEKQKYYLKSHIKFNTDLYTHLSIISYIHRENGDSVSSADHSYSLYEVSNDDQWTETLISSGPMTPHGIKLFKADILKSSLPTHIDGQTTLSVVVTAKRLRKIYKEKYYISEVGIFDTIYSLEKERHNLSIKKRDWK